jgi:hypothetical protein
LAQSPAPPPPVGGGPEGAAPMPAAAVLAYITLPTPTLVSPRPPRLSAGCATCCGAGAAVLNMTVNSAVLTHRPPTWYTIRCWSKCTPLDRACQIVPAASSTSVKTPVHWVSGVL